MKRTTAQLATGLRAHLRHAFDIANQRTPITQADLDAVQRDVGLALLFLAALSAELRPALLPSPTAGEGPGVRAP